MIIVSIFIISFLLTLNFKSTPVNSTLNKLIVIDAGHGGIDTGTSHGNITEKKINLGIAKELAAYLDNRGNLQILMTRTEDKLYQNDRNKDIVHRAQIVKEKNANLLVSIHVNSFPSSASFGGQTFYAPKCPKSKELASFIQEKLIEIQPKNYRKIKEGPYYILKKSSVPAVIVEVGFISNPNDRKRITNPSKQKKIARAIGQGIINYLNNNLATTMVHSTSVEEASNYNNYFKLYYGSYNTKNIEELSTELINLEALRASSSIKNNSTEEIASSLIQKLLAGPQNNNNLRLIPSSTKLINLKIDDRVASVNFNKNFIVDNYGGGTELIQIKSVVNTLKQLNAIQEVKILIEGKTLQTNHFYLDAPLN